VKLNAKAALPGRVTYLESVLVTLIRLVSGHDAELRRQSRELNIVIAFPMKSTAPARLKTGKEDWTKQIPPKSDIIPFPQHPDWAWRLCAFDMLVKFAHDYVATNMSVLDPADQQQIAEALAVLSNKAFYQITNVNPDIPDSEQLWIVRFASTPIGTKLRDALVLLDSKDILDKACMGSTLRSDRAPRGPLVRILDTVVDEYLGRSRS